MAVSLRQTVFFLSLQAEAESIAFRWRRGGSLLSMWTLSGNEGLAAIATIWWGRQGHLKEFSCCSYSLSASHQVQSNTKTFGWIQNQFPSLSVFFFPYNTSDCYFFIIFFTFVLFSLTGSLPPSLPIEEIIFNWGSVFSSLTNRNAGKKLIFCLTAVRTHCLSCSHKIKIVAET